MHTINENATEQWIAHGISIPDYAKQNEWEYTYCPRCYQVNESTPTLAFHLALHSYHCERCGHHGNVERPRTARNQPLDFNHVWWGKPIGEHARSFLMKFGISEDVLKRNSIYQTKHFFKTTQKREISLAFPCLTQPGLPPNDILYMRIDPETGTAGESQRTMGGTPVPLGLPLINHEEVVFVDNPLDWLSAQEARFPNVLCIPSALSPNNPDGDGWGFLKSLETIIPQIKRIVFALSEHESSTALSDELARRFGKERCFRVNWKNEQKKYRSSTPLNLNALLMKYGADSVIDAIAEANAYPIAGLYELDDVEEDFEHLYKHGLTRGALPGYPSLNEYYSIVPGQWTLVTGIPGHGKSNFLDSILINLAKHYEWRFGIFSPENQPISRYFANLMEKAVEAPFEAGPITRISPEQKDAWKPWIKKHFKVILPDDDEGNWKIDGVLNLAKILVYRYGIKGLVIDPWNELDHQIPHALSETQYISVALTKIRRFAKVYGVHVWIVAHPTKMSKREDGSWPVPTPYDVSGGAHWRNKADNSMTVWRDVGEADEDIVDIHIQKIRFKEVGKVGQCSLRCDIRNGCYYDDIDLDKRRLSLKNRTHQPSTECRILTARTFVKEDTLKETETYSIDDYFSQPPI